MWQEVISVLKRKNACFSWGETNGDLNVFMIFHFFISSVSHVTDHVSGCDDSSAHDFLLAVI